LIMGRVIWSMLVLPIKYSFVDRSVGVLKVFLWHNRTNCIKIKKKTIEWSVFIKETERVYSAVRVRPFKWNGLRSARKGLKQNFFLADACNFQWTTTLLTFCWPCIMQWFLVIVQLDAQILFNIFIYL